MKAALWRILVAFVALAIAAPAQARLSGDGLVSVHIVSAAATLTQGDRIMIAVELIPARGWHLYGPEHAGAGEPPMIAWTLPRGLTAGKIVWPPARRRRTRGVTTYEYDGSTRLLLPLTADAKASVGQVTAHARLTWVACRNVCAPGGADVDFSLVVRPSTTRGGRRRTVLLRGFSG